MNYLTLCAILWSRHEIALTEQHARLSAGKLYFKTCVKQGGAVQTRRTRMAYGQ